ncbi:MAG: D-inositol-3-phosphate glycosyltransferase, partial [Caballeronia sp.]|nr:D-inositol-3-phosphate glycosyltransferase [Caballeronia sp.]
RVRRLHQGADDGFPDERFNIEQRLVRDSDTVIAECPQDEPDLISLYQADSGRIDLVPCGFDNDEFHPVDKHAARAELGWPRDRFIALQLGRMVPREGIDTVVRAIGLCNRTLGEEAHLTMWCTVTPMKPTRLRRPRSAACAPLHANAA